MKGKTEFILALMFVIAVFIVLLFLSGQSLAIGELMTTSMFGG